MNQQKTKKNASGLVVNIVATLVIVAAGYWLFRIYFGTRGNLYTNDAQVEEYISPVNTRVAGYIKEVRFNEHQPVKKGDTLVVIDDRELAIQVEQAEAAWLSAQAAFQTGNSTVNTVQSNQQISEANIAAVEARLINAKGNLSRYENLLQEGAATQQQYDQAKAEHDALAAQTLALQRQYSTAGLSTSEARSRLDINSAEIKRTHAALAMAKLNLSYTIITAPYDGVTGRRNLQEGQLVQAGQTLVSMVRSDSKWIVANYKETDISGLSIGKKMIVEVDGLPGRKLTGTVTAISQATGSRYAAVPVDNSTGNFVKVQQRIPVRIDLVSTDNNANDLQALRAGMNVIVTAQQ